MPKNYKKINKVLSITLFLNILVVIFKLVFGVMINSISMIADGFHSLFDSFSNIIGLVGNKVASLPKDKNHPYGHKKFETMSTLVIAAFLFMVAFEILKSAYERFFTKTTPSITAAAFVVMVFTVIVNLFVSWYENKRGNEYNSMILLADSKHTRSDIFVSLSVIIGFILIKLGYAFLDPIIAIVIAIFIGHSGYTIVKESMGILCDAAVIDEEKISNIIKKIPEVRGCHKIRTRSSGGEIFLDMHMLMDKSTSLQKSHDIANKAEKLIQKGYPYITDITIHVEPFQ